MARRHLPYRSSKQLQELESGAAFDSRGASLSSPRSSSRKNAVSYSKDKRGKVRGTFGALAGLAASYAAGNFLTADLVAKKFSGKSAFAVGDGNPGMASIGASLGPAAGAITLFGDAFKTAASQWLMIALARPAFSREDAAMLAGTAVTLGHCFPVTHGFQGGKGVATMTTAQMIAWPAWGIPSALIGLGSVIATQYLCIGGVVIPAVYLVGALLAKKSPLFVLCAFVNLAVALYAHGPAIAGIATGETPKTDVLKAFEGVADKVGEAVTQATDGIINDVTQNVLHEFVVSSAPSLERNLNAKIAALGDSLNHAFSQLAH